MMWYYWFETVTCQNSGKKNFVGKGMKCGDLASSEQGVSEWVWIITWVWNKEGGRLIWDTYVYFPPLFDRQWNAPLERLDSNKVEIDDTLWMTWRQQTPVRVYFANAIQSNNIDSWCMCDLFLSQQHTNGPTEMVETPARIKIAVEMFCNIKFTGQVE